MKTNRQLALDWLAMVYRNMTYAFWWFLAIVVYGKRAAVLDEAEVRRDAARKRVYQNRIDIIEARWKQDQADRKNGVADEDTHRTLEMKVGNITEKLEAVRSQARV